MLFVRNRHAQFTYADLLFKQRTGMLMPVRFLMVAYVVVLCVIGLAVCLLRDAPPTGKSQQIPQDVSGEVSEDVALDAASPVALEVVLAAVDPPQVQDLPKPVHFAERLAAAAEERCLQTVIYDGSYQRIDYPWGDVAADRGVCSDVVVRSYRALGFDLQQLVHEDMRHSFHAYPQLWGLSGPDKHIDHRRVPNLMRFFERYGNALSTVQDATLFQAGDIVAWRLANNLTHIGIVSRRKNQENTRFCIVHNIGSGPVLEDCLFSWDIIGHYRFEP